MEGADLGGENRANYLCPGEVDHGEAKNLSSPRLSSFFSLVESGPLTLQARMTCQCEEDGHINGSWQFGFNGEMCLRFDSENGHWTEVHSGGRRMKEKWESCDRLLQESLHGRLSGLASGFYGVLGENVEDLR